MTTQDVGNDHRAGSIRLFALAGVPVFVHWTFPLGGMVVATFGKVSWVGALYCVAAYTMLILVHEFGHAMAAMSQRVEVRGIYISGLGGHCTFRRPDSVRSALLIVAGGILAQLVIFILAAIYVVVAGWPRSLAGICFINTFTLANLALIVFNLIPQRTLRGSATDGRLLWEFGMHAIGRRSNPWPTPSATSPVFPPDTALLSKPELIPRGFTVGVEILNDDKTPMDFVVYTLTRNLGVDQRQAVDIMLNIHTNGGVLWPLGDLETAKRVEAGIAEECKAHSQPLICRVVKKQ
jgi:ATP-dependent Clp protease adapter protein ClpS/Zn-dependent protease